MMLSFKPDEVSALFPRSSRKLESGGGGLER